MSKVIPDQTRLAAKRGFIRSTAQAYATAIAGGISTTALLALVAGEVPLLATIITWAVAAVSPLGAGLASYLDILSKGIPEDYQDDGPVGRYAKTE